MKTFFLACALALLSISRIDAQLDPRSNVSDYVNAYIGTNAKPYLQPLVDMVSTNIHTGVWDWSAIPDHPYFRIKVAGMLTLPNESMRTFNGKTSGDFDPTTTVIAPTIIGDRESIVIFDQEDDVYVFPGGYDLDQLILGTPQLTIGGVLFTELSGRFLSFPLSDEDGDVQFYGIGGRHSFSAYFEDPPFDFSVGYFYHHIKAGTYLHSHQNLFSVLLGKSGKIFSGHLSANYQTAFHKLDYTYENGAESFPVALEMENSNPWLFEAAMSVKLGPIFLNGAVSYAKFPTLGLGAGLTF